MTDPARATRRVAISLRRWPFGLAVGVRPTIVIEGRGQPSQWGDGTWQLPADSDTTISVFMFVRGLTFGRADHVLRRGDAPSLEYRAPALFFLPGSLGPRGTTTHRGRWALLAVVALVLAAAVAVVASLILGP